MRLPGRVKRMRSVSRKRVSMLEYNKVDNNKEEWWTPMRKLTAALTCYAITIILILLYNGS